MMESIRGSKVTLKSPKMHIGAVGREAMTVVIWTSSVIEKGGDICLAG